MFLPLRHKAKSMRDCPNLKVVSKHLRIIRKITRDHARRCQCTQLLPMSAIGASHSTPLMTYSASLRASSAYEHFCLTYKVTHNFLCYQCAQIVSFCCNVSYYLRCHPCPLSSNVSYHLRCHRPLSSNVLYRLHCHPCAQALPAHMMASNPNS